MKMLALAFVAALVIAGLVFSPVAAAPAYECGTTYTVTHTDNLTKIASKCGTTIADILARNPQITNPNIILDGQVLNISGSGSTTTTTRSFYYTVVSGDTLSSVASKFGVTVWSIKLVNPNVMKTGSISTGDVIKIPPPYSNTSSSSKSTYSYAHVTLSTTSAGPGDSVTVYVYGFPKNASIDYRVGEEGEKYTKAYDGSTGSDGTDSLTITIPSGAHNGEDWVVLVTTTDQVKGLDVYSSIIHITD